jgi:cob(I)alamin adenosyltransferase
MTELLIDSMPLTLSLEEDSTKPGKIIVRGQFAKAGVPTDNKRLYREHLWRREFGKLGKAMESRRVFGELDHPADGRTKLQRVSHLITSLNVTGNEVLGEAEVLDTPNGRIFKAIAKAKGQVGVSSRGFGSTKTLPDGTQEVQEDFSLHTFDFVADPATKTAYPQVFAEERQHIEEAEVELTLEALKEHYPGLVGELTEQILEGTNGGGSVAKAITEAEQRTEERLVERFSEQLRRGMEVIDDEARASIRSELMSDPEVAGARQVLEQIVSMVRSYGIDPQAKEQIMGKEKTISDMEQKLADRELEVQKYKAEAEEMKKLAKEAAYKLHLERAIGQSPSREAIESLIGDVCQYESKEALDERIEAIKAELDRRGGPVTTEGDGDTDETKDEIIAELETRVEGLGEELEKAEKAKKGAQGRAEKAEGQARKAVEIAESLELQLYTERKIGSFDDKDRDTLRDLCEHAVAEEEVDRIVTKFVPQRTPDDDEADRIRARVNRGRPRNLDEEVHGGKKDGPGNGKGGSPLEEVGLDTGDFNRLAGTNSGT